MTLLKLDISWTGADLRPMNSFRSYKAIFSLIVTFLCTATPSLKAHGGPLPALVHDCICQTGLDPEIEVPFFKLGCQVWFRQNQCKTSVTIP